MTHQGYKSDLMRGVFLRVLLALALLLPLAAPAFSAPSPQTGDPESRALALLESMTPQERVGQLFLVTFEGSEVTLQSPVYDLISRYHIGGVVLDRGMDNFVEAPDTLRVAHSLIFDLQQVERNASLQEQINLQTAESFTPVYVPLFIGLSQEGDGYPNDHLINALSPQPSAMTLGASWQPELAKQAGELLGSELDALGVNLLLGPSLDILEDPRPESLGDIGVRSFGGDPYWVGQMGQAFIEGVHAGSENRVAVVAIHLPGFGSADRPLEEEIPTIRKSLNQLTQIELAPFFAVTGNAPSAAGQTDAMLLAHIRYQGFQGNIRDTTRPVSFDPQAFNELMSLPAFVDWRAGGGIIISDQLGTRAVRRSYDATEQVFNAPLVARDAFLAGNDILYLGNFVASGDADSYASIASTSEFFTQKYREDIAFAERVNESVLRILTLKFKLYPSFNISLVSSSVSRLEDIAQNNELIFEIGRQAATLLSPGAIDIPNVMPQPPQLNDQVVFIVDSYSATQCSECEEYEVLPLQAFEFAVEGLYGPLAGNQIALGNLTSYSFHQLSVALDNPLGEENLLLGALDSAEWVIFALQDSESSRPDSMALQRLLSERPDLIQDKIVVVFALNAPYYLDATDISKINVYYGLYSKQEQIADIAARLLFQEIGAPGASPVSVEGTGYELIEATSPDPERIIPLALTQLNVPDGQATEAPVESPDASRTPSNQEPLNFQAGDLLELLAGPILDHNGHPVPDNTPVSFFITVSTEGSSIARQIDTVTQSGMAQARYSIESEGSFELSVASGSPQALSEAMQIDVIGINPEGITVQETQAAVAEGQVGGAEDTSQDAGIGADSEDALPIRAELGDWVLAVIVSLFVGLLSYQVGSASANMRWGVRGALLAFIGGMLSISYLGFGLPGSTQLMLTWELWGVFSATLVGAFSGLLIVWVWKTRS